MGGVLSMHEREKRIFPESSLEILEGRDHSEGLGVDRYTILKWNLNRVGGCGLDSCD
jgi:hypothetical protein